MCITPETLYAFGEAELIKKQKNAMEIVLRQIEWPCPICHCTKDQGHKLNCKLAQALGDIP